MTAPVFDTRSALCTLADTLRRVRFICRVTWCGCTQRTDVQKGATPLDLVLAALVGCTTATATFVARNMQPKFPLDRLTCELHGTRDTRGSQSLPLEQAPPAPAQLQRIFGDVVVHLSADAGEETTARLKCLIEQTERRCPVAAMLAASGCCMKDIKWRIERATPPFQSKL